MVYVYYQTAAFVLDVWTSIIVSVTVLFRSAVDLKNRRCGILYLRQPVSFV